MLFRFLRWLRRKLVLLLILLALAITLKRAYPALGARVGRWISGMEDERVAQAVSSVVSSISEGDKIKKVVEVFRETMLS